MNRRDLRQIAILLVGQAAAFAYPVITTPLLIRRLGIGNYGVVMYAFSCVLLAGLLVDFGFNLSSLDGLGKARTHQDKQRVITETLSAKFLLWSCASVGSVILGLGRFLPHLGYLPLCFPPLLLGNVFFPPWLLQGLGQAKALTAINVGSRLICLALVIALVRGHQDVTMALILQQAPMLLAAPVAWVIAARSGFQVTFRVKQPHGRVLRSSAPLFVSALASGALNYANSVALGMHGSKTSLGQYNAGTRVSGSALTALTPVQSVVLPLLSRASHDPRQLARQVKHTLAPFLVLYLFAGLALSALAAPIASIYLHDDHPTTISVLRLLGLGVCATGVEVWAYSSLIAAGAARRATFTYLGVAGFHVVCAFSIAALTGSATLLAGLWAVSSVLIALALTGQVLAITRGLMNREA